MVTLSEVGSIREPACGVRTQRSAAHPSQSHGAPVGSWAQVLKASEHLAEMIRVGKPAGGGDRFQRQPGLDEHRAGWSRLPVSSRKPRQTQETRASTLRGRDRGRADAVRQGSPTLKTPLRITYGRCCFGACPRVAAEPAISSTPAAPSTVWARSCCFAA